MDQHPVIRPATQDDLPGIAAIHAAGWHAAYSKIISPEVMRRVTPESRLAVWRQWWQDGGHQVFVLRTPAAMLGFCRVAPARPIADPPQGYGELTHLYVDPELRGTGAGHQLFAFAHDRLRGEGFAGMVLWTLEHNTPARAFYERHGMITDGAREDEPDWLGDGVFEVRYVLPFTDD